MTDGGFELDGGWLACEAEGDLHQRFVDPDFDETGWEPIPVPGHWRSTPAFAESDGPVLYRHRFPATPLAGRAAAFPHLRGRLLLRRRVARRRLPRGDRGLLRPPHLRDHRRRPGPGGRRASTCLAVEVACPKEADRRAKRMVTGVFSHWDVLDPDWNPGGLWRPVRVVDSGPVRLERAPLPLRRSHRGPGPAPAVAHRRRPGRPDAGRASGPGSRGRGWRSTPSRTRRWPPASTISAGRSRSTTRPAGGPGATGLSRWST